MPFLRMIYFTVLSIKKKFCLFQLNSKLGKCEYLKFACLLSGASAAQSAVRAERI